MNNNDLLKIMNETYSTDEEFDNMFINTIYKYKLKNYLSHDNYEKWDELSIEEKLEYCYSFFDVTEDLDFAISKQVDIFTRLILLDFDIFRYDDTIECMFGNYNQMGTLHQTTITYNPLIPQKHYTEYLKKLKKKSNVDHLQIPLEGTSDYFKEMFKIWFYHKHKGYTAYQIANEFYTLDEQKQIKRKLDAIKKIYKSTKATKYR